MGRILLSVSLVLAVAAAHTYSRPAHSTRTPQVGGIKDPYPKGIQGAVLEVKADQRRLTVMGDKKTSIAFRTDDKTMIERHGMPIKLSDLRFGQVVMVVYVTEKESRLARSISVVSK